MTYPFESLIDEHYTPRLCQLGFHREGKGFLRCLLQSSVIRFTTDSYAIALYRDPLNVLSYIAPLDSKQLVPLDALLSFLDGKLHIRRGEGPYHAVSREAGLRGAARTCFIEGMALDRLAPQLAQFLATAQAPEWSAVAEYAAHAKP